MMRSVIIGSFFVLFCLVDQAFSQAPSEEKVKEVLKMVEQIIHDHARSISVPVEPYLPDLSVQNIKDCKTVSSMSYGSAFQNYLKSEGSVEKFEGAVKYKAAELSWSSKLIKALMSSGQLESEVAGQVEAVFNRPDYSVSMAQEVVLPIMEQCIQAFDAATVRAQETGALVLK